MKKILIEDWVLTFSPKTEDVANTPPSIPDI